VTIKSKGQNAQFQTDGSLFGKAVDKLSERIVCGYCATTMNEFHRQSQSLNPASLQLQPQQPSTRNTNINIGRRSGNEVDVTRA